MRSASTTSFLPWAIASIGAAPPFPRSITVDERSVILCGGDGHVVGARVRA
jgi:hypothetical protein